MLKEFLLLRLVELSYASLLISILWLYGFQQIFSKEKS